MLMTILCAYPSLLFIFDISALSLSGEAIISAVTATFLLIDSLFSFFFSRKLSHAVLALTLPIALP